MKTYMVHMIAFCSSPPVGHGPTTIRPVRVEKPFGETRSRESELEDIFREGQNDFCPEESLRKTVPSVSCGDVVEFDDGELWTYTFDGVKQISRDDFNKRVAGLRQYEHPLDRKRR